MKVRRGRQGNLTALEVKRTRSEEATGNFDGVTMFEMQDHIQNKQEKAHTSTALQKIHIADAVKHKCTSTLLSSCFVSDVYQTYVKWALMSKSGAAWG